MIRLFAVTFLAAAALAQQAERVPPELQRAPAARPPRPAATPAAPSYKDLKFPPLGKIEIPPVESVTLPGGMKLYLLEDHELPLVSGFALVRTGNLFDPKDKIGLAGITGMVLRSGGTKAETGDQIDERLENIAASVESSIGETSGRVSFSTLKENTDDVLALFRDLLTAPEFREDKLDLAKTQIRSGISRRNDDPDGIAQREFYSILYGRDTPYGWREEHEHIDRIRRDDLVAFYRRYFFPANIMLAVQGDFNSAEMKAKIEKLFAGWTAQQPPVPAFPQVTAKAQPGVYLAAKDDVTQTFFSIGHLGGTLRDKDYAALEVMGDILGGGFQSRLFERVRSKLGYAYSISAGWGANFNHPGAFAVSGSTKSISTADTFIAIKEEIERIRSSEVTDAELKTAKDTVENGFVFNFDTRAKTLSRLMTYEYFGYPKDFIFDYQKAIAAVTKADILRVAKERLRPQDLVIVAVGNPKDFVKPLDPLGKVTPIDLSIPEPKQEAQPVNAASIEQGRELLRRMQQAAGGAEKLAQVRDVYQTASQTAPGFKLKHTSRWSGDSYRLDISEAPFGSLSMYSNGKTGWIRSGPRDQALVGVPLKQAQGEIFRQYFRMLTSDRDPNRTIALAAPGTLDISDKDGQKVRLIIDEKTGLPHKMAYTDPQGAPVEEIFSDFRDVDGMKVPFAIEITQNGTKHGDASVQEFRVNSGITEAEMSKRQ